MAWKLIGGLMLLGVGILAVGGLTVYEKRRLTVLEGWLDLIFYIRTQIDCYLTPIGEIFSTVDRDLLMACMGTGTERSPAQLLRRSRIYLGRDACRLLDSFVREIGGCYREEQVKRCDYYLDALQKHRQGLTEELPARLRARAAVCICVALGAVILLW